MKVTYAVAAALSFVAVNAHSQSQGSQAAFADATTCATTYANAYAPIVGLPAGDIGKGAVAACQNALYTYYQYVYKEQGADRAIVADDKAQRLIEDQTIETVLNFRYPNRLK